MCGIALSAFYRAIFVLKSPALLTCISQKARKTTSGQILCHNKLLRNKQNGLFHTCYHTTNALFVNSYKYATLQRAYVNSLRPRRNRSHFADDIFKCISENENEWMSLRISLKFIPKVRINNIPTLVLIMAWRRPGDKPLSEPMMVSLLTHICVTGPQWVYTLRPRQNCRHFADDIFKRIILNEN